MACTYGAVLPYLLGCLFSPILCKFPCTKPSVAAVLTLPQNFPPLKSMSPTDSLSPHHHSFLIVGAHLTINSSCWNITAPFLMPPDCCVAEPSYLFMAMKLYSPISLFKGRNACECPIIIYQVIGFYIYVLLLPALLPDYMFSPSICCCLSFPLHCGRTHST